jgi:hypothetical protein
MSVSTAVLGAVSNPPPFGQNSTTKQVALMFVLVLVLDFAWVKILKEGGAL